YKNNIRKKIDESLINNHDKDQFKEEIIYLSTTIKTKLDSKSDQFNAISKKRVNSHSIHHYYQILPTPNENHISLYYGDYSFSDIEILYSELRTMTKCSTLNDNQKTFVSETINDVDSSFSFLNTFEFIENSNKSTIDKNEVDPDDNRILEIQQGIDIAKEKLKEYNDFKLIFNKIRNEVANLEAKLSVQLWGSTVCEANFQKKRLELKCELLMRLINTLNYTNQVLSLFKKYFEEQFRFISHRENYDKKYFKKYFEELKEHHKELTDRTTIN
ncbi:22450_t:CDS:2, partial [Gigaspora margarita]